MQTYQRHFAQQATYTVCLKKEGDRESKEWKFAEYKSVLDQDEAHQDIMYKFTIPYTEREKVLTILDSYNLTRSHCLDLKRVCLR
jgi:hypothetical protein